MLGNDLANISEMSREKERGDSVADLAGEKTALFVEGLREQAAFRAFRADIQSAITFIGRVLLVVT